MKKSTDHENAMSSYSEELERLKRLINLKRSVIDELEKEFAECSQHVFDSLLDNAHLLPATYLAMDDLL